MSDEPSEPVSRERGAGGSYVRFEPPDVCFFVLVGYLTDDETRRMSAELSEHARRVGHIFVIADARRATGMSPGARRIRAKSTLETNIVASAIFGASFHIRVIATLILKVRSIMKKHAIPVAMLETEAEARAWLEEQRNAAARTTARR
jgi:hypothetical protein